MSRGNQCVVRTVGVAVLLAVSASPARAQSEAVVRGQVVTAADRSAIAGAIVTLTSEAGGSTEVEADATGRVTFRGVAPGVYVVSGSAGGFTRRDMRVEVEPREVRALILALDLAGVEVEVQVTGQAPATPSTHSPSSTVVTSDRLARLPPAQQANLPEAMLTHAPGLVRSHDDFVHVRGHEVALNPIINGVSFLENPHALLSAGLSPAVIDTANVMTGGFPAEYGNRFGGVIDIVTKSGLRMDNEGSATLGAGQAGWLNAGGEFGGQRRGLGYYLFGSMIESDRYISPPSPEAIHDSGRAGHVFAQIDGALGGAGLLRAVVMGDGANHQIPKTPLDEQWRPLARAEQRFRQQSSIVSWTRVLSATGATGLTASFYQRWATTTLVPAEGPLTAAAAFNQERLTIGGKADVTHLAGAHALKAGVDALRLRPREELSYDYGGFRELTHELGLPHLHVHGNRIDFSGRDEGAMVSAYVQDAIRFGDRVTADLGARVDHYNLVVSATHASPRVNLAVRLGDDGLLHASYNHFFVPPPVEGVLSSSAGLTSAIAEIGMPLPALRPTTEDQFEIGASRRVGPLRLAVTGYSRTTDNPVHTTVWPDARLYSYASFDRERAYGLETRADLVALTRYGMIGYFNYALGRVSFYNPVTGGFTTEAEHFETTGRFLAPMDQTHTLTAGLTYRHERSGAWVGTALDYGSGMPILHGGGHDDEDADHDHADDGLGGTARVPAHFTADVTVGLDLLRGARRRARLSLQVDVRNLTDNLYLVSAASAFTPAQYSIPRLLSASVKVRF
jgi:hypothetical protein